MAKWFLLTLALVAAGCVTASAQVQSGRLPAYQEPPARYPVTKSEADWRKALTPEQYRILREKGTERAFTGKFWNSKDKGIYRCAGCDQKLFDSSTKFDSGTGWPSYWKPAAPSAIRHYKDTSYNTIRTEVVCSRCGGHLGHVFDDGPRPTGLRYCINSAALKIGNR